jgi:hypothetical protein
MDLIILGKYMAYMVLGLGYLGIAVLIGRCLHGPESAEVDVHAPELDLRPAPMQWHNIDTSDAMSGELSTATGGRG